jgi:hypothetical protein
MENVAEPVFDTSEYTRIRTSIAAKFEELFVVADRNCDGFIDVKDFCAVDAVMENSTPDQGQTKFVAMCAQIHPSNPNAVTRAEWIAYNLRSDMTLNAA